MSDYQTVELIANRLPDQLKYCPTERLTKTLADQQSKRRTNRPKDGETNKLNTDRRIVDRVRAKMTITGRPTDIKKDGEADK